MNLSPKNYFEHYKMPTTVAGLTAENIRLQSLLSATASDAAHDIAEYKKVINDLRKKIFAASAEATKYIQRSFFDEAEFTKDAMDATASCFLDKKEEEEKTTVPEHQRTKPKRKPFPDHLTRVEVIHDVKESDKICPKDGQALHQIGHEVLEEVEFIPARIHIIRHITPKYACRACEEFVIQGKPPERVIPKSFASPSLLAHIAVAKYQDALPLYRQEQIFARYQIDLSRTTMAEWMIRLGDVLQPLVNQFYEDILDSEVIHCDETPVQVLKLGGEASTKKSYMWVFGRWGPDKNIVCFDFAPSRSGETASKLLAGYQGYLQVDGYGGYNKISSQAGVLRVGCMAHVRRKFVAFLDTLPKEARSSHWVYLWIRTVGKLYAEEALIREKSFEERKAIRLEKCQPILLTLKNELDHQASQIAPASVLGKAIDYALSEWAQILRYLEHGQCEVDNNKIENAIRPFALGRKNWLFSDSESGAKASANLYSVIETAKLNGKNPEQYLKKVFDNIALLKTPEGIESLMPYAKED